VASLIGKKNLQENKIHEEFGYPELEDPKALQLDKN
jgi:hypothetical protein